ncbi:MAG: RNA polymerase sigma factor [Vicinamibacteria bacterium]
MSDLEERVALAQQGDRTALEGVILAIQKDVYALALRFFWHPEDAEDATQEILLRVVTGLGSFEGRSRFTTWVYRVAANALLSMRDKRMEQAALSLDAFASDLAQGLSDVAPPDDALLLEEIKIGCTLAMLQCLDRDHRMAYIIGEILELDHKEAAVVLDVAPATFRKRLSRARAEITTFMQHHCGLFDPKNACRCSRRASTATSLGRVDRKNLLFASDLSRAERFPEVLATIRGIEKTRRAAALFRSHPSPKIRTQLVPRLRRFLAAPDQSPE